LSGRGLCDKLITRPEESYRLCCVIVCDLETSRVGAPYIYDISNLRVKIQGDEKVSLHLMITVNHQVHRDFLITLYMVALRIDNVCHLAKNSAGILDCKRT